MSNTRRVVSLPAAALCCAATMFLLAPPVRASTNYVINGNFSTIGPVTDADPTTGSFSLENAASNETAVSNWTLYFSGGAPTANQQLNCIVEKGGNTANCGTTELGFGGFVYSVNPGFSEDGGNYYMADGDSSYTDFSNTCPGGTPATGCQAGGYSVPIYQSVSGLTAGLTYTLNFDQAAAQQSVKSGATTEQWEVEFCTTLPVTDCTGNNVQFSSLMNNASKGDVPWQTQTMTFVASASTEILEFIAIGAPLGEPPLVLLDGVSLTQATPEPSTYALIAAGLLAFPLGARLRRKMRASRK